MKRPRVLLVGDLGIDLMISVPTLPQGDEKLTGRRMAQGAGGMAANVAVALARLGTPARLLAAVGDDAYAQEVTYDLAREGVDTSFITRHEGQPTFMCVVLLGPDGEKALVRLPSGAYLPTLAEVTPAAFESITHLHTTLGDPQLTLRAISLAKEHDVTVSIDIETADIPPDPSLTADVIGKTNILFVNKAAREALLHHLKSNTLVGPHLVVTTLGRQGSTCDVKGRTLHQAGVEVTVKDTTGAGDAFAGAFLHQYLAKDRIETALRFASAAASLSTLHYGAQAGLPTTEAVRAFLNQHRPN